MLQNVHQGLQTGHPLGDSPVSKALPRAVSAAQPARRSLAIAGLLLLAAAAALAIDFPVARWCRTACPLELKHLLHFCEPFGHGVGVFLILLTVFQLDKARRWAVPRILTVTIAAGLAADVVKMFVERFRPRDYNLEGMVWDSFSAWFPLLDGSSGNQSFPSGHTATAAGLAAALVWLYPRGYWLFPLLAVLVAAQRVTAGAHYCSDVLAGGALGLLVATFFLHVGPLARRFDRWEKRWEQA